MRKLTALCLALVAMFSFSVASADVTAKWEVLTGTDASGAEVWTEVADPIDTGITVPSLSKLRVTFDGLHAVANSYSGYEYLYNEDLVTKAFTNSPTTSISNLRTVVFDVTGAYYTPDKPFTTEGTYYMVIPEKGLNFYATEADYTSSPKVYTASEDVYACKVTIDNDFAIQQDMCSIDIAPTWFKQLPTEFEVTIDGVTSLAVAEGAQFAIYKSSTKQVSLIPTIEGNKIKLVVDGSVPANATGDMYVWILANSLIVDGDAAKSNNHLKFGAYVLPSGTSFRDNYPEKDSKVLSLDKFYINVGSSTGTFFFEESLPAVLNKYNEETAAWEYFCDLTAKQVDGKTSPLNYDYITIEYAPAVTPEGGFALGKYQVSIPEKSVFYEKPGSSSTTYYYLKAKTIDYELAEAPVVSTTPVWSIENGAALSELAEVTVTFEGATSAKYYSMKPAEIYKKIGNSYTYASSVSFSDLTYSKFTDLAEAGKVILTFTALKQEGEYKIVLPAGALAFDGFASLTNEASEIKFKISSNAPVKGSNVVISPATGSAFSEIPETFTLTLNNPEIVSVEIAQKQDYDENWNYVWMDYVATFTSTDSYVSHKYAIAVDPTDCKKLTLTKMAGGYGEMDPTKEYYLTLPTGALIINKDAETSEYTTNDELNLGSYYADYIYEWEVRTGVDANGADVWTKVANPLEEGITVSGLDKARLTVVGAHSVKAAWNAYCYLYKSDLETKVFNNGATKTVTDNQIVFDFTGAYYTPDKPYTVNGEYCALIAENLIEIFRTAEDVTAKVSTKNPDVLGCFITIENNSLVGVEDCSIDVASGWYKSMPTEFNITINNDEVLKTAIADASKVGLYSSSTLKSACNVAISEDGKTLTLTPTAAITSSGDFYLYILANTLTFNDDAALTNNHLKFGPYTLPSSTSINEINPKAGKVTKLDSFRVDVRKTSGTFHFDEENVAVLNKYDDETSAWVKFSDLVAAEATGYNYKTINYTLPEDFEGELPLGKYQVSIPEKSFFLETVSATSTSVSYNKAYAAEYELCEVPNIELTPVWDIENGSTFSSLAETYVTFAGASSATFNSMNAVQVFKNIGGHYSYVTDANCAEYDYNLYKYVVNIEAGGRIKLVFGEELKEEGEYKIVFPAGALAFDGFSDVMNQASELNFAIESNAPIRPSNVTITPAVGGITDFPATFEMTIDNADIATIEVGQYQDYDSNWDLVWFNQKARLTSTDNYISVNYDITVDPTDCKKVTFTIAADNYYTFDATKKYYFELPSGALLVNKDAETGEYTKNDAITQGLYETVAFTVAPSVDEVLYSVKDFVITANTPITFAFTDEAMPMLNYEDPEFGMISPLPVAVVAVEGTDNQYLITTGMDVTMAGNYALYIPAGAFLHNGTIASAEYSAVYTVVAETIDEVTTAPAQGELDINSVGGTFRSVNVLFPAAASPNPDFKGEITLAIDGTVVTSVNKYSKGELYNELGIIFPDKFTRNGIYTVTVPRGAAIYADGTLASSQVFTWNVTGGFTPGEGVSVDPEEGEVASLSVITLTFNEKEIVSKNVFYNTSALAVGGNVVLRNAAGEVVAECATGDMGNSEAGYNTIEIKLCEPGTSTQTEITAPGLYTMTVPAGIVNFNKNGANPCTCGECYACTTSRTGVGNANYNEELTFSWVIPTPAELVATPADGSVVESLINVILDWADAKSVVLDDTMMIGGAKLYKVVEDAENEFVSDMICSPVGEGSTTAVLDILNVPTEDGVYVVEIAEGMFTVDGRPIEATTLTYTIASTEVTLEQISAETFLNMLMTVSPCETLELNTESIAQITLAYLDNTITEVGYYEVEILSGNTAALTLSTNRELVNGDYVIWIPDGQFFFDGKPNNDIKIYYEGVNIVGIEGIDMDAKNLNIYNVNGMLIKRNGSLRDLNELEPGIYVVNGQKMMVK